MLSGIKASFNPLNKSVEGQLLSHKVFLNLQIYLVLHDWVFQEMKQCISDSILIYLSKGAFPGKEGVIQVLARIVYEKIS